MGSPPAPNLAPLGGTGPRAVVVRGPYSCPMRTPVGDGVAELGSLAFDEGKSSHARWNAASTNLREAGSELLGVGHV